MSEISDAKREIQEAKKLRLSWRTKLLIIVIGAPTTFLFALYGRLELALPLMNILGVLGLMILFKWKLRKQAWFWITLAVIAALHVPLILFVPWGTKWVPALAIAVIASLDFCLILWIFVVVEKLMGKQDISEGRSRSR
ncbi:MAG: hypothetical protein ACRD8A_06075 [Candidatus Acidiferrales bacterium]